MAAAKAAAEEIAGGTHAEVVGFGAHVSNPEDVGRLLENVKQPIGDLLLSNTARAGLTGFLKTISTELAPFGITVNALLPGTYKTSRIDQLVTDTAKRANKSEEDVYQEMVDTILSKAIGDPADFGAAAAFLAGTPARYITGQNLLIDGGRYGDLL